MRFQDDPNQYTFENLFGQRCDDVKGAMAEKNIGTAGGYYAKVTGDIGELQLSSVLKSLPDCYHVIDNVLLRTRKGSTQLDHIVVSPFGVFVIETKNYKGMIFGDMEGIVWTQVLNGAGHFKVYNPVRQNYGHIVELCRQTRIPIAIMQGVIVFTNPKANLSNVNCPCCFTVDRLYEHIVSYQTVVLSDRHITKAIERIDKVNIDSYLNRQKHIAYVNSIKNKRGY